jgi:hypothetical protein
VVDDLDRTETDIVYCDTYGGGAVSDTVDVVITADGSPAYTALQDRGITVVKRGDLEQCVDIDDGYVVAPDELQQAISAADDASERFMEWLETYRKRQTTS